MTAKKSATTAALEQWALPAVLVILALAAWVFRYGAWLFFSDTSTYVQGAQGIAEGNGYRLVAYEFQPPIGLYPPLHSALLSLAWRINPHFPDNFGLLWCPVAMLGLASAWLFFVLLRRSGMPIWLVALLVLNWGLAPRCLQMASWLFSDPGFILGCFGLLFWLSPADPWPWPLRRWIYLAVFLVFAFFLRSSALGLIGAFGLLALGELRRNDWRPPAAMAASFGACVVLKRLLSTQQGPDYGSVFQAIFTQLGGAMGYARVVVQHAWTALSGAPLWEQFSFLGYYLAKSAGFHGGPALQLGISSLWTILFWALLALAIHGWWIQSGSWKKGALLCVVLYTAQPVLVPWDSENFGRYLNVLQPLFWIWVWQGARSVPVFALQGRLPRIIMAALLIGNIAGNLAGNVVERRHWRTFFSADELKETADWTRTNTPVDSHIAIDYRLPAYYFYQWLGRPVLLDYFNPNRMESPVTHASQQNVQADYAVLAEHAYGAYAPPPELQLVHSSPKGDFKVYSVTHGEKPKLP